MITSINKSLIAGRQSQCEVLYVRTVSKRKRFTVCFLERAQQVVGVPSPDSLATIKQNLLPRAMISTGPDRAIQLPSSMHRAKVVD